MNDLKINATNRSPAISFEFSEHRLTISGESYPEDVTEFYDPVLEALSTYLQGLGQEVCRFDFELIYFNSSSAKMIMTLMEMLDEAAERGANVEVHWFYDEEDDTMEELGGEFGEDLEHAKFFLKTLAV